MMCFDKAKDQMRIIIPLMQRYELYIIVLNYFFLSFIFIFLYDQLCKLYYIIFPSKS